ncbi:NAD(P)/FAD-dependent oxidoreductase [Sporichthya sp.]|uniref:NAD(P)/FAD-dependent oxidoreductase n=1 Tax=Sporichthya sp. TaxID=65475 RepID=UPI0017EDE48D|nr:FAD-dependent oxidoreductase [Sporichthya sp.]MBA3743006.1 FAD-dependent oxidoreductase [Sporichthya sp.]
MRNDRLVVVGASLAGLRAVEAARKSGYAGPITLIGNEPHLPYDRPPLSKAFLDAGADVDGAPVHPTFRDEATLRDELDVDLRLGAPATALAPAGAERQVVLRGGDAVPYTRLIIATGGDARMLPGGDELAGVHLLRTLDDAIAVRAALDAGARTVVVGAGFIGSEVASAARKRGLSCTVLEALPVPLVRSVGEATGKVAAELHRKYGTDLRCGVGVTALEGSSRVEKVVLDDGTVIEADLVVVGIGVRPATGWLQGSGIALHERDGGILCDETLATSLPGVYAAGDVAHFPNLLFGGQMMRVEQWTNAAEQGALAARNALDPENAKPSAAVPYFWSDWYESRIQFVGIPQSEEIRVVSEELGEEKFLALYRRGDQLGGVLTVDRQSQIMKYKRLIAQQASWAEGLAFAGVTS